MFYYSLEKNLYVHVITATKYIGLSPPSPSVKCTFICGILCKCQEVVRPEFQGGKIPDCNGLMQWPSSAPGSTGDKCRSPRKVCWKPGEHLRAPMASQRVSGSAAYESGNSGNNSESTENKRGNANNNLRSTSNHSRAVWEKLHLLCEHCWCAWKSKLLLIVESYLKLMYSVAILI